MSLRSPIKVLSLAAAPAPRPPGPRAAAVVLVVLAGLLAFTDA